MDWTEGIDIRKPYELYNKMMMQHAGLRSLQELMLSYVSLNIDTYCTIASKTGTNPFNVIQPAMKRRLLEMEGMKHGVKRRLGTRLSNRTSQAPHQLLLERGATWFSSTVANTPPHLLHALTVQCPHLLCLSLRLNDSEYGKLKTSALSSLLRFSQLQLLHVLELVCDDKDLNKIAQGLPNLRVLRISLAATVSKVGVAALSKLKHLREFSFFSYYLNKLNLRMLQLLRLSLQLMPQLRVAGERFTHRYLRLLLQHGGWRPQPRIVWDNHDVLVRMLCKELLAVPRPNQLGLEQVALVGASRLPDHLALPNLESLVLLEPRLDILQPDERLSRVSELVLLDASMDNVVTPLLSQMGQQLRSLSLRVCMASLDAVLRTCPNLTELNLHVTRFLKGFEYPAEQLQVPQQLQVLRIEGTDHEKQFLETGLLTRLLKAPLLSRVRLDSMELMQKDTEDIMQLLADRAILQRLKKFSLRSSGAYDPIKDVNHREFLASAIVVHCPMIEAFDVHVV